MFSGWRLEKVSGKSPDWGNGVALFMRKCDSNMQDDVIFMDSTSPFFTAWGRCKKQEKGGEVFIYLTKPNRLEFVKRFLFAFFRENTEKNIPKRQWGTPGRPVYCSLWKEEKCDLQKCHEWEWGEVWSTLLLIMMLSLKALRIYTKGPLFSSSLFIVKRQSCENSFEISSPRYNSDFWLSPKAKANCQSFFVVVVVCFFLFGVGVNKLGNSPMSSPSTHTRRISTDKADRAKQARQTAAVNSQIDLRESSARKQMHLWWKARERREPMCIKYWLSHR